MVKHRKKKSVKYYKNMLNKDKRLIRLLKKRSKIKGRIPKRLHHRRNKSLLKKIAHNVVLYEKKNLPKQKEFIRKMGSEAKKDIKQAYDWEKKNLPKQKKFVKKEYNKAKSFFRNVFRRKSSNEKFVGKLEKY